MCVITFGKPRLPMQLLHAWPAGWLQIGRRHPLLSLGAILRMKGGSFLN